MGPAELKTYALVAVVPQARAAAMLRSGRWASGRCTAATQTLIRAGYVDHVAAHEDGGRLPPSVVWAVEPEL